MNQTAWSLDLNITKDGPKFRQQGKFEMEGYDRIDVVVPAQSSWVVKVQPGQLDDIKLFFVLRTDQPGTSGDENDGEASRKLYYTIGDNPTQIQLSDLHVVLGSGAIRLLCDTPDELCFTNEGEQDANVTILICRQTAAPCEPAKEPQEETPTEETTDEGPKTDYPPETQSPRQSA
jgi:hypothetical protein